VQPQVNPDRAPVLSATSAVETAPVYQEQNYEDDQEI
jgi:hypothetical protein